jgi:uncharacterized membrane protein (DUF485 family)
MSIGAREGARVDERREWARVAQTSAFHELMRRKKAFIIPATIFFLIFYFGLPILAAYTTLLNFNVIGAITGAYIYAFAQFAMTWILMHLYVSRANSWDGIIDRARHEAAEKTAGGSNA